MKKVDLFSKILLRQKHEYFLPVLKDNILDNNIDRIDHKWVFDKAKAKGQLTKILDKITKGKSKIDEKVLGQLMKS